MRRFVLKVAIWALALVLTNLVLYLALPAYQDNEIYLAAINDKFALLETTQGPKIIFVGTSELAFGLDSAKIKDAFGMSVVNMGLHVGIGIRTTLESIRSYIGPDDIIIISAPLDPIPNSYFYGYDSGTGEFLWLLKLRPSMIWALNTPYQWRVMIKEYPNFIKSMKAIGFNTQFRNFYLPSRPLPKTPYHRSGFNQYGDLIAHLDLPNIPPVLPQKSNMPIATHSPSLPPSTEATAYFNDYRTFVNERGASIYTIWPPQLTVDSQPMNPFVTEQNISNYADGNSAVTIPMLGSATSYQFPPEFFYEIPGHLNKQGRAVRTEQLIEDLSEVIDKQIPTD